MNKLNGWKSFKKEYAVYTAIYFMIVAAVLLFTVKEAKPYLIALFFGCIFAYLSFLDLADTLEKSSRKDPASARIYAGIRYVIRYLLTGVVIAVAIRSPYMNVVGTVLGLISIKLVIFAKTLKK